MGKDTCTGTHEGEAYMYMYMYIRAALNSSFWCPLAFREILS